MRDEPLLKAVAGVVKDHVSKAFAALRGRIDGFDSRLSSIEMERTVNALGPTTGDLIDFRIKETSSLLAGRIDGIEGRIKGIETAQLVVPAKGDKGERGDIGPVGKDGRDGTDGKQGDRGLDAPPVDTAEIVKAVLAQVPIPKDGKNGESIKGEPGLNGKDAPVVNEAALAASILAKIPTPVNGKDGINGKDAPPVDTKALSDEILGTVLKHIPAPIPGKDGRDGNDGESPNANDIVKAVLAQIPPPIPGKDAPLVDTKALADEVTHRVLGQIPTPENGKDAPAVDTKAMVDEVTQKVLGQIPAPVNGRDGKDAPAVDTKALSYAIVEKVLGLIPEPKAGVDGKDGVSVDPESVRILIAGEVTKALAALPKPTPGRDGRDGRVGEKGDAGKDAADFDILDGIDESMSYQRGVFASHLNSLFRAYRTTDPVVNKDFKAAGWQCLNAGMVAIVETLAPDQRTVIKTHEFGDGSIITSQYKSVAMIDREVWKEDVQYEQGDNVTMAGGIWVCRYATQDRPGLSKAWRLAVKRGSDGKDLRPKDDDDRPLNGKGGFHLGVKR